MSNKINSQNQLKNFALGILKNLMRSLTAWLKNGYCSITVANHWLITVIKFVAKSYIHPWKDFTNRLHLALHACKIFFLGKCALGTIACCKQSSGSCLQASSEDKAAFHPQPWTIQPRTITIFRDSPPRSGCEIPACSASRMRKQPVPVCQPDRTASHCCSFFKLWLHPMLHGYWYGYRIRYVSDTRIRTFSKKTLIQGYG